jgi:hypothetical protein
LIAAWGGGHGLEAIIGPRAAAIDEVADVHRAFLADHDVVAAGRQSIARLDGDVALSGRIAHAAHHLEAAHDPSAEQMPVVQPALGYDVVVEPVEIFFAEQLAGEEAGPAQTLEAAARGAHRPGVAYRCGPAIR